MNNILNSKTVRPILLFYNNVSSTCSKINHQQSNSVEISFRFLGLEIAETPDYSFGLDSYLLLIHKAVKILTLI